MNEQITNALAVVTKNLPIEEARKTGAQALFGEKYGDVVRVVDMSGFSVEFCGGTHVKNTSEITALKIISESGVAAGVRRIEALTSEGLMNYYAEMERLLKEAAQLVKATPENLAEKITHLQAENKSLKGEVESLKSKMAQSAAGDILDQVKEVKGVKLLAAQLDGVDMNGLRDLGDQLKEKLGEGVVVLASGNERKSKPDGYSNRRSNEAGSTRRKSCESNCRPCWRRRRWSSEHGPGRWKEPSRNPGCTCKSRRSTG